jgi:uroporphyrinogen decarboxylase
VTHRERVLAAISLREPDRIPLDFGSVGGLMVDELYHGVRALLGLDDSVPPYRSGSTANWYDERILEAFDVDFRHLWLASPDRPERRRLPGGAVVDEWGITWSAEGSYPEIFPLRGKPLAEIVRHPWPLPSRSWNLDALAARARHLREDTDFAVVAKGVLDGAGIFERCCYLRSYDDFLVDMCVDEPLARALIDRVTGIEMALWDMYLDAVGPWVDIVQRASDLGTQSSLMISPELYRRFLVPAEKRVFDLIRKKAPGAAIWFHSCGAVGPLIADFLDLGVKILNPVQPLAAGMESGGLKRDWGSRLCFHGGIDLQRAMVGTLEDVREEVRLRVSTLGRGGGYILAPANHLQKDTPPQNVVELYRFAAEYGRYPLAGCRA